MTIIKILDVEARHILCMCLRTGWTSCRLRTGIGTRGDRSCSVCFREPSPGFAVDTALFPLPTAPAVLNGFCTSSQTGMPVCCDLLPCAPSADLAVADAPDAGSRSMMTWKLESCIPPLLSRTVFASFGFRGQRAPVPCSGGFLKRCS